MSVSTNYPSRDSLASGAASAPRCIRCRTEGLTPNGSHFEGFDDQPERASVRFVAVLMPEPDASAFRLIKVSAIGLTPPRSPVLFLAARE